MLAIFLLCLDWYCFMVCSGIIFLIAGIFVRFGIGMILCKVSYYVTNDMIGRSTGIVSDSFWNVGYVYLIIGLYYWLYILLEKS